MRILQILIFLCLFLGISQNHGNVWYFGQNAGLDFSTQPPTPITGSLDSPAGCSSICDDQGNLIFYTDGATVWDASHNVMSNGAGLWGDPESIQSCVILKNPRATNVHYIYTVDDLGISRSIVSVNTNDPVRRVRSKNISPGGFLPYIPCNPKIANVPHADSFYSNWVTVYLDSTYFVYGINAYVTTIGSYYYQDVPTPLQSPDGSLRFSPDGNYFVNTSLIEGAVFQEFLNGNTWNTTGFNSQRQLQLPSNLGQFIYGAEFSPDSQTLYLSVNSNNSGNVCSDSNNQKTIIYYTIDPTTDWYNRPQVLASSQVTGEGRGALQLGPDGKIYVARPCSQYLGVIDDPNNPSQTSFTAEGLQLMPGTTSKHGLPNIHYQTFQTLSNSIVYPDEVQISPNPTSGLVQLKSTYPIRSVKLHDLNGRLLNKTSFVSGALNETVNLENLNSGIYLMTVETSEGKTTERVVVK